MTSFASDSRRIFVDVVLDRNFCPSVLILVVNYSISGSLHQANYLTCDLDCSGIDPTIMISSKVDSNQGHGKK